VQSSSPVSVIIPTYNRAHLVGRAIRSVLAQTYEDWECIMVDDCSTDDTEAVVKGFSDPRIRYVRREKNGGGSAARNTGIREARGKYLAFLDSDDEWRTQKLEKQIHIFEASDLSNVGLVYCGASMIYDRWVEVHRPRCRGNTAYRALLKSDPIGSTSRVMIERRVLLEVGGFDEALPARQDHDLWLRIAEYYQVDFSPECLVILHRGETESRITTNWPAVARAHELFYHKHRERMIAEKLEYAHVTRVGIQFHRSGQVTLARTWYRKALTTKPRGLMARACLLFSGLPHPIFRKLVSTLRVLRDFADQVRRHLRVAAAQRREPDSVHIAP
jgi:glycosyltransferase involved in cell wall biosynthesis